VTTPVAIILAGLAIAAAILIVFRWDYRMAATADSTSVIRIDRWTGEAMTCFPTLPNGQRIEGLGCYSR
jgi:hypothetical protein